MNIVYTRAMSGPLLEFHAYLFLLVERVCVGVQKMQCMIPWAELRVLAAGI